MASPYETVCSRCHKHPVSRTWGVTVGSKTYCQACVPRINVGGQHYTLVSKEAHLGSEDDNKFLVRCPNSGEGCEWTGELSQLENHLNTQPTTADNLLDGCQFEMLSFKRKHYNEVKPQNELHTQQLQDFKIIIVCVALSLLVILVSGGLMNDCLNSDMSSDPSRLRAMVMNEIKMAKSEVETAKYKNEIRTLIRDELLVQTQRLNSESGAIMQHELLAEFNSTKQVIVDDLGKEMEELRMSYSSLESKHEQMVKEVEEVTTKINPLLAPQVQELNSTMQRVIDHFEAKGKQKSEMKELLNMNYTLTKLIHDNFNCMQDRVEDIKQHIEVLKSNQSALESKYEGLVTEMAEAMTETAKELERKYNFLTSQVVSLESHVSDLNNSQHLQELGDYGHSVKHTEITDIGKDLNDEWLVDEITELNQQVNSLVLPKYRIPLLLRKQLQDNYMVSAPFYTNDEGYMMRALAHPIAKDDSNSLRMVVCLCVLQGKYDQTLWWPLNARFTLTLYMNETNWKTEEVTFPSDKSSDDSFINSLTTRNFFTMKDGSCVEYEIKKGHNVTATLFHLDIVKRSSWWEFTLQVIGFFIHLSVYLWYAIVTLSTLLVLWCFYICISVFGNHDSK